MVRPSSSGPQLSNVQSQLSAVPPFRVSLHAASPGLARKLHWHRSQGDGPCGTFS